MAPEAGQETRVVLGRTAFLALALLGVLLRAGPTLAADEFPTRPIQMIIPAGAGGGTDTILRVLASVAEPYLGQKIIIVNKPGGGGTAGMEAITRAKPDGYTVGGLWNAPLTISPHMFAVPYKPTDYAAISLSARSPGVFCVRKDFPANDGHEFIAELKKNPDKYTYGNDGVGGTLHLAAERIFAVMGVKARPIPFTSANETLNTLLTGAIDIYSASMAPVLPFVKEGRVKCLLVTTAERSTNLPETESLGDLGIPEQVTSVWRGIIAPVGLPPAISTKLENVFEEAARDPKFVSFAASRGEQALGEDGAALRKLIDQEYGAMGAITAKLGIAKK